MPVGVVSYSTTIPTTQPVIATLTLNRWGEVLTEGWTGDGYVFTKVFTGNTVEEVVYGKDGLTTTAKVEITRIDEKAVPQALAVTYTPSTATTGNVEVRLFTDKVVKPIEGWAGETGQMFTKIYANNMSEVVQFTDLAGNVGMTGVKIDWIEIPEQNY
jgi:hypothetical protein